MFNGSEHFKRRLFPSPFERIGATDQNGTTNNDPPTTSRNVPTTALDVALWMESDRMGHLLGAIDSAKLTGTARGGAERKTQGETSPTAGHMLMTEAPIRPAIPIHGP